MSGSCDVLVYTRTQVASPGGQRVCEVVGKRQPLNQGTPPCSFLPGPRRAAGSDRFWLLELRVSQHFSTFYGPSVQAMDTQLNGLPTLPVLARTVSGYLNSAFLGLERNRSVVGKTKAPLPLHSIVTCRSRSGCHTLETLRRGKGLNGTQPAESIGNG